MAFYLEIFFAHVDNKPTIFDPFSPLKLLTVNVKLTALKLTVNAFIFASPIFGIDNLIYI